MKLITLFKNAHLDKIKLGPSGVAVEISFDQADKDAAWELYIEMLT